MTRRFDKILIANRGEIACRIIRTARFEGYRTVAVYSDADAGAPHVTMADEAVHLGPSVAAQSYLNIDRVIAAANHTSAQAVHPGYGFLSENRAFAQACEQAGIVFIGPPPSAIHALGNKAEAKRLVRAAGVPCVPGYEGEKQDDATLKAEAKQIGFPVLLKASMGGGGRGMRRVASEKELDEAIRGARSEAKNSFGFGDLIVEKLIDHARHVEIQIIADEHGNCIHLGERDCSVQRRHQKIIEESPCPVLTPELRKAMGAAAVNAAQAAGYVNAGTVEFLLDDDGNFYFLEVNTRLQVEHPVTEMVTGLDLVALQLRVAQGEPLALAQDDVEIEGHAIEVRLYAEDPSAEFAPQVGRVLRWEPGAGLGMRVDHGLSDGYFVSPFYDSMLAKIIAHRATRAEAIDQLDAALRKTLVLGIRTNAELLRQVLQHPTFAEGNARTNFLDGNALLDVRDPSPDALHWLVAGAAFIERAAHTLPALLRGWRSTGGPTVPLRLAWRNETQALKIGMLWDSYRIDHGDAAAEFRVTHFCGNLMRVQSGDHSEAAHLAFDGDRLHLKFRDRTDTFHDVTYAPPQSSTAAGDGVIKAPMVGQVVRVNAQPGAAVAKGAVLVVIEAMKMENQIVAPYDGEVESVSVSVGDQVDANQLLMKLTAKAGE